VELLSFPRVRGPGCARTSLRPPFFSQKGVMVVLRTLHPRSFSLRCLVVGVSGVLVDDGMILGPNVFLLSFLSSDFSQRSVFFWPLLFTWSRPLSLSLLIHLFIKRHARFFSQFVQTTGFCVRALSNRACPTFSASVARQYGVAFATSDRRIGTSLLHPPQGHFLVF